MIVLITTRSKLSTNDTHKMIPYTYIFIMVCKCTTSYYISGIDTLFVTFSSENSALDPHFAICVNNEMHCTLRYMLSQTGTTILRMSLEL